jgi:hypothetical protein
MGGLIGGDQPWWCSMKCVRAGIPYQNRKRSNSMQNKVDNQTRQNASQASTINTTKQLQISLVRTDADV